MKLEDVLNGGPGRASAQDHLLLYLDGSVEGDDDAAYFRLYRNPQSRRSYLLIKKADVAGDLYAWTAEEANQAGFVGARVYRVPLKFGTELQNISVTIHKLGETIGGRPLSPDQAKDIADAISSGGQAGTALALFIATMIAEQLTAYFNPKEVSVDKSVPWGKTRPSDDDPEPRAFTVTLRVERWPLRPC